MKQDRHNKEGNCDLCFLKGAGKRMVIMRERPGCSAWWAGQERATDGFFDRRSRYADLQDLVSRSPLLPFVDDDDYTPTREEILQATSAAVK